jgi:hypothetical protein
MALTHPKGHLERMKMHPDNYLAEAVRQFRKLQDLNERAVAQVSDKDLFATLDEASNSIAIIMKHMAGNMRSRWTDFLISDGEKPDRNRDTEFVIEEGDTWDRILEGWNAGWRSLFEALAPLTAEDLSKTVVIRGEPHSVMEAINRQLTHYAYHVGQIVFLAKHFAANNWQSLSIPRRKSDEFNAAMRKRREQAP